MSLKVTAMALAIAVAGTLSGAPAWSQTTSSTSTNPELKLAAQYSALAGSQRNADSLVAGLRDGKNVLLLAGPGSNDPSAASVTFTPVASKFGYGNINIALALAEADLTRQGITNPTPEQLAAALNGGTIVTSAGTITMAGVLAQRQAGMGWGQIANAQGATLGSIISASKTGKAGKKEAPAPQPAAAVESAAPGKSGEAHGSDGSNKGGNSQGRGNGGGGNSQSGGNGGGGKSSNSSGSSSGGGGKGK